MPAQYRELTQPDPRARPLAGLGALDTELRQVVEAGCALREGAQARLDAPPREGGQKPETCRSRRGREACSHSELRRQACCCRRWPSSATTSKAADVGSRRWRVRRSMCAPPREPAGARQHKLAEARALLQRACQCLDDEARTHLLAEAHCCASNAIGAAL